MARMRLQSCGFQAKFKHSVQATLKKKGVVGTLPGIDTQGSYVAVVFKLNSRWPETTVYCPKTLCSGHLENKGLVATILFPGMARMRLQSCGFEAKFKVA